MFRTGPIRNFTASDVTVVACVLASETPIPTDLDVSFSVVQLEPKPVLLHSRSAVVASGEMVEFEATLARSVRNWEVRVEADPDLVFVTIYHVVDGKPVPNLTYHTGELYYVDVFENDSDPGSDFFTDMKDLFGEKIDLPPNWLQFGEDGDPQSWWSDPPSPK